MPLPAKSLPRRLAALHDDGGHGRRHRALHQRRTQIRAADRWGGAERQPPVPANGCILVLRRSDAQRLPRRLPVRPGLRVRRLRRGQPRCRARLPAPISAPIAAADSRLAFASTRPITTTGCDPASAATRSATASKSATTTTQPAKPKVSDFARPEPAVASARPTAAPAKSAAAQPAAVTSAALQPVAAAAATSLLGFICLWPL